MGVPGVTHGNELHFLSNSLARGGYTGDLTVTFGPAQTVTIVWAHVARNGAEGEAVGDVRFIWKVTGEGCSDFPESAAGSPAKAASRCGSA